MTFFLQFLQHNYNKKSFSVLLGLTFVGLIEWWIGWGKVLLPWLQFSPNALLIAALLIFFTYQVRTLRLYNYFYTDLKGYWWATMRLALLHTMLNNLMPMRSGEASFPILMKRYFSVSMTRSLPALLWFRLLDLHTLVALSMAVFLFTQFSSLIGFMGVLLWMSLPYGLYLLRNTLLQRLKSQQGLQKKLHDLLSDLPDSNVQFIQSWLLTCTNWVLKLLVLVWVLGEFMAVDQTLLFSSVIAGELSSVLPFHAPGGMGTYEAGAAAPLLVASDTAVVMPAVINLHLFILSLSVIGGMIAWFIPTPKKELVTD